MFGGLLNNALNSAISLFELCQNALTIRQLRIPGQLVENCIHGFLLTLKFVNQSRRQKLTLNQRPRAFLDQLSVLYPHETGRQQKNNDRCEANHQHPVDTSGSNLIWEHALTE